MIKMNSNPNLDAVEIGGSIATVGVGSQIPAISAIADSAISSLSASCGAFKSGALIAKAIVGTVGAPALIIGGLAIVGYALFSD